MGCESWGTLWHRIKGRKQCLSEFATLPIIQMILNANYPLWLRREWPVTQDVACLCWALSQKFPNGGAEACNIVQFVAGQVEQ